MGAELIRGLGNITPQNQGSVITLGNFDGVHLGHQALLAKVQALAKAQQARALVAIFEPQPLEFISKTKSTARLTRLREKYTLLANAGVDGVLVIHFNHAFASLTAEQFVTDVLVQRLKIRGIIVGEDFHFGKARQGNVAMLQTLGQRYGFSVQTMPTLADAGGERVSSTRIRRALEQGDLILAEHLLGHPYFMTGRVRKGQQLGRVLGFPTANIDLHRTASALHGIFAVRLSTQTAADLPGVAYIGTRSSVGGMHTVLEVYIFNFADDLYGQLIQVEFCHKLRDDQHFDDLGLLKAQIAADVAAAKQYFERQGKL